MKLLHIRTFFKMAILSTNAACVYPYQQATYMYICHKLIQEIVQASILLMPSYKNKSVDNYIDRLNVLVSFSLSTHELYSPISMSFKHSSFMSWEKTSFQVQWPQRKKKILHTKPCWEALYFGLCFRGSLQTAKMEEAGSASTAAKYDGFSNEVY